MMSEQAVARHFENAEQQREAASLGTWVFLATEFMFFGPLLFAYCYGRIHEPAAFAAASRHTDIWLGTANTAVLLTSSLTMALAVRASRLGAGKSAARLLVATATLGVAFLTIKSLEYWKDWHNMLVPAFNFAFEAANRSGAELFFDLYFLMTGIHALHLAIGIVLVSWLVRRATAVLRRYGNAIEMTGLYWHFVDVVWVILYPALYLLERYR
jgi:cytochrome c oxidase subunit 3